MFDSFVKNTFAKKVHRQRFTGALNSASLSGDGRRLAGGDVNGVVIVYDFGANCEIFRWRDPSQVLAVNLSYLGDRVVLCGDAKVARMFHVQTGAPMYERQSTEQLVDVKVSSDGNLMAVSYEGKLNVVGINHGAQYHSFELHQQIRTISIDRPGKTMAIGCGEGNVFVYRLHSSNEMKPHFGLQNMERKSGPWRFLQTERLSVWGTTTISFAVMHPNRASCCGQKHLGNKKGHRLPGGFHFQEIVVYLQLDVGMRTRTLWIRKLGRL